MFAAITLLQYQVFSLCSKLFGVSTLTARSPPGPVPIPFIKCCSFIDYKFAWAIGATQHCLQIPVILRDEAKWSLGSDAPEGLSTISLLVKEDILKH